MSFEWIRGDTQVNIIREKKQRKTKENMVGCDKEGYEITQHDDPGSYMDCTRPSNLEKNPEGAAVACPSSTAKAISQVSYM